MPQCAARGVAQVAWLGRLHATTCSRTRPQRRPPRHAAAHGANRVARDAAERPAGAGRVPAGASPLSTLLTNRLRLARRSPLPASPDCLTGLATSMLPAHKHTLETLLADTVKQVAAATQGANEAAFVSPTITLERPKVAAHGDVACNVAMQLAKPLRANPRQLAQQIVDALLAQPRAKVSSKRAEVAGPGFINLRLAAAAKQAVIAAVFAEKDAFGRSQRDAGKHVLIEFVSANPTGPLHVGHGRQAALGDALANAARLAGLRRAPRVLLQRRRRADPQARPVDAGARPRPQARRRRLARSTATTANTSREHRARLYDGVTVAANDGEPVTGAGDIEDLDAIRRFAVAYLRREQDMDLQAFGVKFDQFYLESRCTRKAGSRDGRRR